VNLSLGQVFVQPSINLPLLNHSIDFSKIKISTVSSIFSWSLRIFIVQSVITANVLSDKYTTKSSITSDYSIDQAFGHHSIDFLHLNHPIDFTSTTISKFPTGTQYESSISRLTSSSMVLSDSTNTISIGTQYESSISRLTSSSMVLSKSIPISTGTQYEYSIIRLTSSSMVLSNQTTNTPTSSQYGLSNLFTSTIYSPSLVLASLNFQNSNVGLNHLKGISKQMDNLFHHLRKYNKEFQTRRQLNLDVPAGFHQENDLRRQFRDVVATTKFVPTLSDYDIFQDISMYCQFIWFIVEFSKTKFKNVDHFIHHLRQYYGKTSTKRQLLVEVRAGFQTLIAQMEVNLRGYHCVNAPPIYYQDQGGDPFTTVRL
jgi:hypothetical protein